MGLLDSIMSQTIFASNPTARARSIAHRDASLRSRNIGRQISDIEKNSRRQEVINNKRATTSEKMIGKQTGGFKYDTTSFSSDISMQNRATDIPSFSEIHVASESDNHFTNPGMKAGNVQVIVANSGSGTGAVVRMRDSSIKVIRGASGKDRQTSPRVSVPNSGDPTSSPVLDSATSSFSASPNFDYISSNNFNLLSSPDDSNFSALYGEPSPSTNTDFDSTSNLSTDIGDLSQGDFNDFSSSLDPISTTSEFESSSFSTSDNTGLTAENAADLSSSLDSFGIIPDSGFSSYNTNSNIELPTEGNLDLSSFTDNNNFDGLTTSDQSFLSSSNSASNTLSVNNNFDSSLVDSSGFSSLSESSYFPLESDSSSSFASDDLSFSGLGTSGFSPNLESTLSGDTTLTASLDFSGFTDFTNSGLPDVSDSDFLGLSGDMVSLDVTSSNDPLSSLADDGSSPSNLEITGSSNSDISSFSDGTDFSGASDLNLSFSSSLTPTGIDSSNPLLTDSSSFTSDTATSNFSPANFDYSSTFDNTAITDSDFDTNLFADTTSSLNEGTHAFPTSFDADSSDVNKDENHNKIYNAYVQTNVDAIRQLSEIAKSHGDNFPLILRLRTKYNYGQSPDIVGTIIRPSQNPIVIRFEDDYSKSSSSNSDLDIERADLLFRHSDTIESPDVGSFTAQKQYSFSNSGSGFPSETYFEAKNLQNRRRKVLGKRLRSNDEPNDQAITRQTNSQGRTSFDLSNTGTILSTFNERSSKPITRHQFTEQSRFQTPILVTRIPLDSDQKTTASRGRKRLSSNGRKPSWLDTVFAILKSNHSQGRQ